MIKVRYSEYFNGFYLPFIDWSKHLVEPPRISRKVESENKGEAGLIVYDDADISFYNEAGNPVNTAFERDLSSVQRYIMEIYDHKSTKTGTDADWVKIYEGMANFPSIEWPDLGKQVSFSLIDKISALGILQNVPQRDLYGFKDPYKGLPPLNYDGGEYYQLYIGGSKTFLTAELQRYTLAGGLEVINQTEPIFKNGEIISLNDGTNEKLFFVKGSYTDWGADQLHKITYCEGLSSNDQIQIGAYVIDTADNAYNASYSNQILRVYEDVVYKADIYNRIDIYQNGQYVAKVASIDGIKFIKALISQQWPDISIVNRSGGTTFPIPLEYWEQTISENPFEKEPLDALKMIANSMRCYIYTDRQGSIVIQKKTSLGTNGTTRTLGNTRKIDGSKKYCWDKLIDAVQIEVESWVLSSTGEYLVGTAYLSKSPNIKPKNQLNVKILAGNSTDNTQAALDAYAAQIASEYMTFYGNRHWAYPMTFHLDDNTREWELLDNIVIDGIQYFFTSIDIDLVEKTVDVELVSVASYNYDLRQAALPMNEQSYISSNSSSGSSGGYFGYTGNPYLWDGGPTGLDPALGRQTLGLGNVLSDLAGKEPAIPAGSAAQYWRGDKTWQDFNASARAALSAATPLIYNSATGALSLSYTNNFKLTSGQLDTAQGIKTSDTPWWTRLGVGGAADATFPLKITGNARITGNLTIDGDIYIGGLINEVNVNEMNIADRVISLNRNGDNTTAVNGGVVLNGTGNTVLASILYDGARWSFSKEVKMSGTGTHEIYGDLKQIGNKSVYNNYTSGWAGAGYKLGLDAQGNSFLEIDNINVRKTLSAYEFLLKQISAVNGFEFISSSARVENAWYDGGLGNYYITFEDPTSSNLCPFSIGDMVICQVYKPDAATLIRRVEATVWEVNGRTCMVLYNFGQAQKGDVLVRIGNEYDYSRSSSIYLAADDPNSPFIDIITGVDSWDAWNNAAKTKARFGNLSGITDPILNPSGYGFYADNVFIKGRLAGSTVSGTTTKTAVIDSSGPVFFASLRNTARTADNLDVYAGSFYGGSHFGWLMLAADSTGVNKELFRFSKQISNGAITAKVGPWNFDETKFSNGNVRIEASTAFKGFAVKNTAGEDVVMFGDFINASESYGTANVTGIGSWAHGAEIEQLGPGSAPNYSFSFADNSGTYRIHCNSSGTTYNYYFTYPYKTLPINDIKGKVIKVQFSIKQEQAGAAGSGQWQVVSYIKTNSDSLQLTSAKTPIVLDGVLTQKEITAYIPSDATSASLVFACRINQPALPTDLFIGGVTITKYTKTIAEYNAQGVKMYSSPKSMIALTDSEAKFNVPVVSAMEEVRIGNWRLKAGARLNGSGAALEDTLSIDYWNGSAWVNKTSLSTQTI